MHPTIGDRAPDTVHETRYALMVVVVPALVIRVRTPLLLHFLPLPGPGPSTTQRILIDYGRVQMAALICKALHRAPHLRRRASLPIAAVRAFLPCAKPS
jgi:hypothetical protein